MTGIGINTRYVGPSSGEPSTAERFEAQPFTVRFADSEIPPAETQTILAAANSGDMSAARSQLAESLGQPANSVSAADVTDFLGLIGGTVDSLTQGAEDLVVEFSPNVERSLANRRAEPTDRRLVGLQAPSSGPLRPQTTGLSPTATQPHRVIAQRAARFAPLASELRLQDFADTLTEGSDGLIPGGRTRSEYAAHVVSTLRPVINDAARLYDLPPESIMAILSIETGGDEFLKEMGLGEIYNEVFSGRGREFTSMGIAGIQVRRAAEALETALPDPLYEEVRETLSDPLQSIYVLGKHLSDLRDMAAAGAGAEELTDAELEVIGALFYLGPPEEGRDTSPEALDAYLSDAPGALNYGATFQRLIENAR